MARTDTDVDWSDILTLRTGYGNLRDVGYGWDEKGLELLAQAINLKTERAWRDVEDWAKRKRRTPSGALSS